VKAPVWKVLAAPPGAALRAPGACGILPTPAAEGNPAGSGPSSLRPLRVTQSAGSARLDCVTEHARRLPSFGISVAPGVPRIV